MANYEQINQLNLEIIGRAIKNAIQYQDIWTQKVTDAYISLQGAEARSRARSELKVAIAKYKDDIDARDYLKFLDGEARKRRFENASGASRVTDFPDLDGNQQLFCGDYDCTQDGVYLDNECICSQPLYISKYIKPIDDSEGTTYAELSFYVKDGEWKHVMRQRRVTCDAKQLLELSNLGIDITTQNNSKIIDYFRALNMWSGIADESGTIREIPTEQCFSRFGWIDDGKTFLPYTKGARFIGDEAYKGISDAMHKSEGGSYDKWCDAVRPFYAHGAPPAVRIALAAVTASLLLGYTHDGLPFLVHFYGGTESGKTVTLKLAASVFGYHEGLICNFNSTQVGLERRADVLNNIPLFLDELGVKGGNSEQQVSELIYQLAEGMGRTRGRKEGGIQKTAKWHSVTISNGEHPIVSSTANAGVINRVISVNVCDAEGKGVFRSKDDLSKVLDAIEHNYGYAAEQIISVIKNLGREAIKNLREAAYKELEDLRPDGMNKQLLSASFLATADDANQIAFGFDEDKSRDWLINSIAAQDEVDLVKRGMALIEDIKAAKHSYFFMSTDDIEAEYQSTGKQPNVWGVKLKDGWAYIPEALKTEMQKAGFNYDGFVAEAKARGIVSLDSQGRLCRSCRIFKGEKQKRCLVLKDLEEDKAADSKSDPGQKPVLRIAKWG